MSVDGELGELRALIRQLQTGVEEAKQRLTWLERESQTHSERITNVWRELIHKPSKAGERDRPITNRDVLVALGAIGATLAAFKAVEWLMQVGKP